MSKTIIPNTNPNIELVEVGHFDDDLGPHIRHQPVIAWAIDPEHPETPAVPITTDEYGSVWGLHDRATGEGLVPEQQSGRLHHTLAYLGWREDQEAA